MHVKGSRRVEFGGRCYTVHEGQVKPKVSGYVWGLSCTLNIQEYNIHLEEYNEYCFDKSMFALFSCLIMQSVIKTLSAFNTL